MNLQPFYIIALASFSIVFLLLSDSKLEQMAHSPVGERLSLREYNMIYQASPLTSPPPESLCSFQNSPIDAESSATLTWSEIKVIIHHPTVVALDKVTGFAEPYRMLAIMGPSGSGKSTLLQTLAGRLTRKAILEGDILVNGRRQQLTYGTSAFLTANDVFLETLTVKEHLCLSAFLRLPSSMARSEKLSIATETMANMGLKDVALRYCKICPVKGLSVGQRRLLSLAVEILIGPRLIYFDDAIDYLEGVSALTLMMKLRSLSRGGCTVIVSMRHASSHVFELLDDLCLLSNGKNVYFGDSSLALEQFSSVGFPCPPLHSPADHFIYTISSDYEKLRATYQYAQDTEKALTFGMENNLQTVKSFAASYENSELYAEILRKLNTLVNKKGGVLVHRTTRAGTVLEMFVLTYRSLLSKARSMGYFWMQLFLSIFFMLSIGSIFFELDHSESSIQERAASIFFAFEGMMFLSMTNIPYLLQEIEMHMQERINCDYGACRFVMANTLASLPLLLLISLVPLCSTYFLVKLHSGALRLIYFVLNIYLSLIVSESMYTVLCTVLPNLYTCMLVSSTLQGIFMLVGGYMPLSNHLPLPFWKYPISYISFHKHALQGIFQNEFRHGQYHYREQDSEWWSLLILSCMAFFYRLLTILLIYTYECTKVHLSWMKVRLSQHRK